MPDGRLYRSMLLDYYGELLTPRQRECYDLHYNEDLSLSEIADHCGISRQGAWDNIHRASEAMESFEEKTGLLRRTMETEKKLREILRMMEESSEPQKALSRSEEMIRALLRTEE